MYIPFQTFLSLCGCNYCTVRLVPETDLLVGQLVVFIDKFNGESIASDFRSFVILLLVRIEELSSIPSVAPNKDNSDKFEFSGIGELKFSTLLIGQRDLAAEH